MLLLVFTVLLLLSALNFYLGKSIFYPAFVYCATWTLALFCLLSSGNMFFALSADTLAIFMWGAVTFTIGCALGQFPKVNSSPQPREPHNIIGICLFALVLAFPFYLHWLVGLIADNPDKLFLSAARDSLVEIAGDAEMHPPQYVIFTTLLFFAPILAIFSWMERKGRMKRALLAIGLAFVYHVLTGARSAMIQLLLALLCVEWLTVGKLKIKVFAAVGVLAVLFFGLFAVIVHGSNAKDELIGYIGGPLVAYDRVVREPQIVPHNLTAASAFLERAYKLGADIKQPSRESAFIATGPNREDNVFTIYFAYINVGMVIGCILLFWEAFVLCLIYRSAVQGSKIAIAVYSLLFSYIAMTTFSDWLLGTLEASVKLACLTAAFYYFLPLKARLGNFLRRASLTASQSS
jgi:oligosaccharide repeat unit polymerase